MTTRFDFEYEDDGEEENGSPDIENKYYSAKSLKTENPDEAIKDFLEIPALEQAEGDKGDWGFKALKQAIKVQISNGRYDAVSTRSK